MIKQLSVFVENKQGALVETAGLLAEKKISATETEMRILLEAAVAEFNNVFHNTTT